MQMTSMVTACATVAFLCAAAFGAESIPPGESGAKARLDTSPRHGEWVDIALSETPTPLRVYVVYPERKDKAPVVIVIHEIFGLSDWVRGVADQLAADGFIAVAPDFISGKGPGGGGTESVPSRDDVPKLVRQLPPHEVIRAINAAREYGLKQPAANGKSATIGYCWGGTQSFLYATTQPALNAAVVYYGSPPAKEELDKIACPVAGFYGEDDARITVTIAPTVEEMKKRGKTYLPHIYKAAGHGFLRAQDQRDGANLKAAQEAWPATVQFLTENTK